LQAVVTNNKRQTTNNSPCIAVFDSGFGGLTVLRALLPLIPGARFLYLGDTARLPYGSKSRQTIARYALSSAAFLLSQGAEMLVVACNTASALALDELTAALPIPVVGVIQPGVQAARSAADLGAPRLDCETWDRTTTGPQVLVLATAATVQSGAYSRACSALGLAAYEKACPLLVPLVEEGWIDHSVTAEVARIYLSEALAAAPSVTTLVLGCTHYPLLKPLFERTLALLNHPMRIVDSATAAALAAQKLLPSLELSSRSAAEGSAFASSTTFYATDSIEKFQRLGSAFLGRPLPEVHLIDLGG
jgi:glutamate racemase